MSLIGSNGEIITDEAAIKLVAVNHFHDLFNEDQSDYPGIDYLNTVISKKITPVQAQMLTLHEEIFKILKSMKRNRTPGPDGFNVKFFLKTWDIVGPDFLKAAHFFLETGNLPHYINAMVISLVPKCQNP